jgi:hypothetical protein
VRVDVESADSLTSVSSLEASLARLSLQACHLDVFWAGPVATPMAISQGRAVSKSEKWDAVLKQGLPMRALAEVPRECLQVGVELLADSAEPEVGQTGVELAYRRAPQDDCLLVEWAVVRSSVPMLVSRQLCCWTSVRSALRGCSVCPAEHRARHNYLAI